MIGLVNKNNSNIKVIKRKNVSSVEGFAFFWTLKENFYGVPYRR